MSKLQQWSLHQGLSGAYSLLCAVLMDTNVGGTHVHDWLATSAILTPAAVFVAHMAKLANDL